MTHAYTYQEIVALDPCSMPVHFAAFEKHGGRLTAEQAFDNGATIRNLCWVACRLRQRAKLLSFANAAAKSVEHLQNNKTTAAAVRAADADAARDAYVAVRAAFVAARDAVVATDAATYAYAAADAVRADTDAAYAATRATHAVVRAAEANAAAVRAAYVAARDAAAARADAVRADAVRAAYAYAAKEKKTKELQQIFINIFDKDLKQ